MALVPEYAIYYTCMQHTQAHLHTDHTILLLSFTPPGALLQYLRNRHDLIMKTDVILDMAVQICSAMQFLESIKFIHRDLVCNW